MAMWPTARRGIAEIEESSLLLDSNAGGSEAGTIPGARNIRWMAARSPAELPKDKELIAFCAVGWRGYLACRLLAHMDFRCRTFRRVQTYKRMSPQGPAQGSQTPEAAPTSPSPPFINSCCAPANRVRAGEYREGNRRTQPAMPGPIMRLKDETGQGGGRAGSEDSVG
jgi:hypothetical protein